MQTAELIQRANNLIARQIEANKKRPRRNLFGVRVYEKYGDADCRLRSLCQECINKFEPPTRVVKSTFPSGTRSCDYCDALNIL